MNECPERSCTKCCYPHPDRRDDEKSIDERIRNGRSEKSAKVFDTVTAKEGQRRRARHELAQAVRPG